MGKESLSLESQEFGQNQVSDDMLLSNSSFQQLSENTILLSGPYSLKARELCQILSFFFSVCQRPFFHLLRNTSQTFPNWQLAACGCSGAQLRKYSQEASSQEGPLEHSSHKRKTVKRQWKEAFCLFHLVFFSWPKTVLLPFFSSETTEVRWFYFWFKKKSQ